MSLSKENEKILKLLRLAFDPGASDGEAEVAAAMLVKHCRKAKLSFEESMALMTAATKTEPVRTFTSQYQSPYMHQQDVHEYYKQQQRQHNAQAQAQAQANDKAFFDWMMNYMRGKM